MHDGPMPLWSLLDVRHAAAVSEPDHEGHGDAADGGRLVVLGADPEGAGRRHGCCGGGPAGGVGGAGGRSSSPKLRSLALPEGIHSTVPITGGKDFGKSVSEIWARE